MSDKKIETIQITVKLTVGERVIAESSQLDSQVFDAISNKGEVLDEMTFALRRKVREGDRALTKNPNLNDARLK